MANTIKIKNSGTTTAVPTSLEYGELGLNYADGKLYYKNLSNNIVEFGGGGSTNLDGLTDVVITNPLEFQTLEYNGTNWVNANASSSVYVRNAETTTLTTGTVVYLFGATGDHATVKRADNSLDTTSSKTVGVVSANILPNENGVVVTQGYVDGINLSVGYTSGQVLWLGKNGAFTTTKTTSPDHLVYVGVVVRATNNGIIYVSTQNGFELDEIHNVQINNTLASGDFLKYNGSSWINDSIDLGTDTNGNYVASLVAGTGISLANNTGEGATPTISLTNASLTIGTTSIALGSSNTSLSGISSFTFSGSSSGTVQLLANATAGTGTVITLPATTGTIITTGDNGTVTSTMISDGTIVNADINASAAIAHSKLANATSGQVLLGTTTTGVVTATTISGDIAITGAGVATIQPDSVALGTDTTGSYVASLVAGTGISLANNTGEGATPTITNAGVTSIAGTAGQITASASTGSVTLSLPSNITDPLSNPKFSAIIIMDVI